MNLALNFFAVRSHVFAAERAVVHVELALGHGVAELLGVDAEVLLDVELAIQDLLVVAVVAQ